MKLLIITLLALFIIGCKFVENNTVQQGYNEPTIRAESKIVYGLITINNTPITNVDVLAYLKKNPDNILQLKTLEAYKGYYNFNINSLRGTIGDILIVEAGLSGFAKYKELVINEKKQQELNIELETLDYQQPGTKHVVAVRILVRDIPVKNGIISLKLGDETLIDTQSDKFGYYALDLANLRVGWYIGDTGEVLAYYQNKYLGKANFTINSELIQYVDIVLGGGQK